MCSEDAKTLPPNGLQHRTRAHWPQAGAKFWRESPVDWHGSPGLVPADTLAMARINDKHAESIMKPAAFWTLMTGETVFDVFSRASLPCLRHVKNTPDAQSCGHDEVAKGDSLSSAHRPDAVHDHHKVIR